MNHTTRLAEAVAAVCPVEGVSVGTQGDASSVRVDYRPQATANQRNAAASVVAAFDWSAEAHAAWLESKEADLVALRDNANQAVADIDSYLRSNDAATTLGLRDEVRAVNRRQKLVIKALLRLIRKTWR